MFNYDHQRFKRYSGAVDSMSDEACLAQLIMAYHVLEKGLTMPRRHLWFAKDAILGLIKCVTLYGEVYNTENNQYKHAIGVIRAYYELHKSKPCPESFGLTRWRIVESFVAAHQDIQPATQNMETFKSFYSNVDEPFPVFARSRHTVRHYAGPVSKTIIEKAVELAMTAPSACNRQHARVVCVDDKEKMKQILESQNGNRGFGSDADKLLLIGADLRDMRWREERNDIYTNAGMFLMNLCYALHYNKVAHCILNWSVSPEDDLKMRKIIGLQDAITVVALVSCGMAPEEFDVATSPRRDLREVLRFI